jgi:hypothetical protein
LTWMSGICRPPVLVAPGGRGDLERGAPSAFGGALPELWTLRSRVISLNG